MNTEYSMLNVNMIKFHPFFRNPGGSQATPWCYVDIVINQSVEKVIELCDIPRCSDEMWMYVIGAFASFALIIIIIIFVMCWRKYKKNVDAAGMTNIQNVIRNFSIFFVLKS